MKKNRIRTNKTNKKKPNAKKTILLAINNNEEGKSKEISTVKFKFIIMSEGWSMRDQIFNEEVDGLKKFGDPHPRDRRMSNEDVGRAGFMECCSRMLYKKEITSGWNCNN